jgi:pyruvate/2-oxoglutarate dehydrogenase complex dihydrolipoamide dehydrogenase (E3) component
MDSSGDVDVVVVGLGSGGQLVAHKLAEAGLRVVGVERRLVGGECPFFGCTPSKLMIRAAHTVAEGRAGRHLAGLGAHAAEPSLVPVATRIREVTHDWHDRAQVEDLEGAGVRVVRGHGRLAGPGAVTVETPDGPQTFRAARGVVLGSGTEPASLPIEGLDATPYWSNREAVHATEAPARLVVVGGGAIGAELAQAFSRLGSRVTLLEAADRLLAGEEPEAAQSVHDALVAEGLDVRTGVTIDRVDHAGVFRVAVGGGTVEAEQLLVAAGRRTNLHDLGLGTVGLDPGSDTVEVDERLRAGERLWAVGDITGKGSYTHVAKYQAIGAVRDVLGQDGPPADYRAVTRVTFTDPEVGAVGLTEAQAREQGIRVLTGHADIASSSRGWIHEARGVVKVVADADRGILVGATTVAPYGGEVIGLLATAVHAEVPVDRLRTMHFAFPTFHRAIEVALRDLG